MMTRAMWMVGLSITLISCGGMRDRLRSRASSDLRCPPRQVSVMDNGLGSWSARGCARSAHYVCGRGVCALEGPVEGGARDTIEVTFGAWTCQFTGARRDVVAITTALETREPRLSACTTSELVIATERGNQFVDILHTDTDQVCVAGALYHLAVDSESSGTATCRRPP